MAGALVLAGLLLLQTPPAPTDATASSPTAAPADPAALAQALPTVAESSDFKATARYDEVMDFCRRLDELSDTTALVSLGRTFEERDIPVLILADPPVTRPGELNRKDRLVVFAFGDIHAGEVCGKEGLLMLARQIGLTPRHPLLRDLVILIAPIYNADGNERVSRDNRPGQNGPEEGMGQRHNAQDLDLNRDFIKLDSPEARALIRFVTEWDPALVIDTHTTNGSNHRYTMTYDGARNPAGNAALLSYTHDTLLPQVRRRLMEECGYDSFYYGNFDREHTMWHVSYPATGRYSTPYFGLRNRLSILTEAYAYASYRDRVLSTRDFVRLCFETAAQNRTQIAAMIREADAETVRRGERPAGDDRVPLRNDTVASEGKIVIRGFVEEAEKRHFVSTGVEKDYEVEHFLRYAPTLSVPRPFAYLVPAEQVTVAEKLHQHGIAVDELREDIDLDLGTYRITKIHRSERTFQGHHLCSVEVEPQTDVRRATAGTFLVRTGQPLGTLAVYLLEPQSEDGLATWGFFDSALGEGGEFPVARLPAAANLSYGPAWLGDDGGPAHEFTYETLYGGGPRPQTRGASVAGFRWLDDGEHYLRIKGNQYVKVHAESGRVEPFVDADKLTETLTALEGMDPSRARRLAQSRSFEMTEDETTALFEHNNDLYAARLDGSWAARLTRTPGSPEQDATFSPDGKWVAYSREFDLYAVDLATQTERTLTTGGNTIVRNGRADWVYYEELFNRSWKSYWWSPASTHVAFLQLDDSPVGQFTVIDHMPPRQENEQTRYPKAGDPNPTVRVGIVALEGGEPVWADLSAYDPASLLVSHISWRPDGSEVIYYAQNRQQTWLDFNTVPVTGGAGRTLFRDATEAWIESPGDPTFLKDGGFLLTSERSGFKHLYRYTAAGVLVGPVTSGDWEVRSLEHVDEAGGWVYFAGTRDSAIASNLYRARLDSSGIERLTPEDGSHRIEFSPTGSYFVDTFSSHDTPPVVRLRRATGENVRTIEWDPLAALARWRRGRFEYVQIPARDGFVLHGSLLYPPDFSPDRRYPVWLQTYAGPHAPVISDSWRAFNTWDQMLAQLGVVVFHVDPRAASGKGARSAWAAYRKLGVTEMEDLSDAVEWLAAHPWVDRERIGMQGYSYGGYMTAYALTHSKLFAAGIAGAPVTDWRNYDTIYTERYMDTPQNNPEGYKASSVVDAAANLHGRLLLVHGSMDDNVHLQNTLQLARALQEANKDFEMMIYPTFRHGVFSSHFRDLQYDFIRRTMRVGAENGRTPAGEGESE